jgi:hypothetical protein
VEGWDDWWARAVVDVGYGRLHRVLALLGLRDGIRFASGVTGKRENAATHWWVQTAWCGHRMETGPLPRGSVGEGADEGRA